LLCLGTTLTLSTLDETGALWAPVFLRLWLVMPMVAACKGLASIVFRANLFDLCASLGLGAETTARISRLEGMEGHAKTADIRLERNFSQETFDLRATSWSGG
jgi:hypothetical protein